MNKSVLYISAVLLCGGSLFCSVALWVNQQNNLFAMLLAGVFAVALELCKFAFFPIANELWSKNKIASLLIYVLSFILLTISIMATVAFLENGSNTKTHQLIISSDNYKILTGEVNSIERQITTLNNLMNADLKNGYRKRAYSKTDEIKVLRAKKQNAINKLNTLNSSNQSGINSLFESAATKVNATTKNVRQATYTIIAILIDVCGIACLILISSVTKKRYKPLQKPLQSATQKHKQPVITGCNAETVKKNIVAGRYGNKPVMRSIIAQEQIRHPALKQIFIDLLKQGLLKKSGNGFELKNKL